MSVTVGIHVHAEPERLDATLAAVRGFDVLLLGDGPDAPTLAALDALELPQSTTADALGPPACLNRLAANTRSDVVILLEAGAIPAPEALERLVAAGAGLAGPSTNEAWNEQCAFPGAAKEDVARTGELAARRFGGEVRSLAPLYSLGDFCFAVRREVIDAIGGADEGFGRGPCWEMEYSARAARAGFDDVWVCGAYVHRAPFTERRRRDDAEALDAGRRRYQDSLCALRLLARRAGYEPHCRGEACEHFAPPGLIRIHRPLRGARPRAGAKPLVSCVMPTGGRVDLALHAVRLFQRQDYEPRELIVVDDGADGLAQRLPDDPRVRVLRSPPGVSIGEKRNRAIAEASGAFVAQWDDDDWYGERRLSCQLAPLLAGRADITGLCATPFFELEPWRFWTVDPQLHARLFRGDVHGGTLVYAREVWERRARYPAASLAEDAAFLIRAQAAGARLERVRAEGLFVYLRHGANAWRFPCGTYLGSDGWRRAEEPTLPPEDRAFYAARSHDAPPPPDRPLVSCIMPTADRRRWVPAAIEYFLRQDYANRELVVLDDGDDRVADLIPPDPRIRYVALDERLVLGDKRNRAVELARGDVIAHWDDDDWQAPHRLRYQLDALQAAGAALCGANKTLYFSPAAGRAWLYTYPHELRGWVAGSGLCYRRALWQENRFVSIAVGEDTRFVWDPRAGRPLLLDDHRFLAALIHEGNSSRKLTHGAYWRPQPIEEVKALLADDWSRYTG